jgi:hypothetical protein
VTAVLLWATVAPLVIWAWMLIHLILSKPLEYRVMSAGRWLDMACVVIMGMLTARAVGSHTTTGDVLAVIYAFTALEASVCAATRTYYRAHLS